MSVIVTTSFSQDAIFYAGETVSCTISFTHSLQHGTATTKNNNSIHARAHSFSSFDQIHNRTQPNGINRRTMSVVEDLAMVNAPSRKMSLVSLASSTFSFLTGSTSITTKEPESIADPKEWKDLKESSHSLLDDLPSETTIELEDDEDTPRSSIDTQSQYTSSRRSSIDSTASTIPPPLSRHTQSPLHRLSVTSLNRSSPYRNSHPEHLLWGFAQVVGQFVSDPVLVKSSIFTPLKSQAMYHPFGGGGAGMLTTQSSFKRESQTTPVFSTPPSILFVDLNLAPGETVKYSYKLKLPKNLPPTYKGKSMRFNYYLVIGSQRSSSLSSSKPFGAQGHVVQIPFRVFNHVTEDGNRPIYDLMNPEIHYMDQAIVEKINTNNSLKKESAAYFSNNSPKRSNGSLPNTTIANEDSPRQEFMNYIDGLLEKTASKKSVYEIMQRENDLYEHNDDQDDGMEDGETTKDTLFGRSCRQIISRITNISKRATFDICKNNQRVAQLHLLKTLYRLGEPVQGIIDFEGAVIPTFQISVFLESNEVIDSSLAQRQPHYIAKVSRKKHAGHHGFCRYDRRLTFSLAVPTSESPEFQTTGMKLQYYLKLEFITSEQASFDFSIEKQHNYSQSYPEVQSSNFDCQIPIHIFGSSNNTVFGGPHIFTVQ